MNNSSGSVVERYAYDPYGSVTFLTPSYGLSDRRARTAGCTCIRVCVGIRSWTYTTTTGLFANADEILAE